MSVPIINPPTFTRSSVAYKFDGTQVAANVPRFETGRFGQAVMVEEGTTNIGSPASLFDSSWTLANGTSTVVIDTYTRKYMFTSTPFGAFAYKFFTLTTGVAYTWSAEIMGEGSTVGKQVRLQTSAESAYGTPVTLTTEWQRVTLTFTATDTSRAAGFIGIPANTFAAGDVVYIRNFQWEQKPYATSFIDGTRSPETLTIPTAGVLSATEGTVEFRVNTIVWRKIVGSGNCYWALNGSKRLDMWLRGSDGIFGVYDGASWLSTTLDSSYLVGQWRYIAYTWGSFGQRIYVDGTLQVSTTRTITADNIGNILFVGGFAYTGHEANALFDDLRISSRARTDAEILAAYQSNAPLVVDKWTTYKLNFDDNLNFEQGAYTSSTLENIYIEYDIINSTTKKYVYKIEWLTPQEEVIGDVIGDIISGSANFDATNNNRRSVSLTLRNLDKQYIPSPTSKMWINNKFRLLCGYEYNGEQILYNQGIYVLGNPSLLSTPTQKEVTIEGLDKWVLLDGTIAGTLANKYIINVDTRIDEVVKSIITDLIGETKYIIDECSVLTPYTMGKPAGSTIADMLLELANMASYSIYYNEEGYLCFKNPLKPEDYAIAPPVWQYTTSGLYLQSTRELNWNDIRNSIIVYGMTENGYQYTATAKDLTGSELSIDKIGERVKVIEDDNIYSDDLCQQRANYELQQSIMAQETVNITSIPNFKLKLDDVVNVEDENNGTTGNYVIRNISYDLSYRSTMDIGVWAIRNIG